MASSTWNWTELPTMFVGAASGEGAANAVIRSRLESLPEGHPYREKALQELKTQTNAGVHDRSELTSRVLPPFMEGLRQHLGSDALKDAPTKDRYTAFKTAVTTLDGNQDVSSLLGTFDKAPAHVQEALMNATTNNPQFIDYLMKSDGNAVSSILTKENIGQYGNQIADILNTIANKDGYSTPDDFKKLDTLGNALTAYGKTSKDLEDKNLTAEKRAELEKQLKEQQKALFSAVKDAGGNVPGMANLNGGMILQFMRDLFGGNVSFALSNLADGLGLQGEELAAFNDLMKPIAGFMKFMGQPYADFFEYYGPKIMDGASNTMNQVDTVMNGQRVEFQKPTNGSEPSAKLGENGNTTKEFGKAADDQPATTAPERDVAPATPTPANPSSWTPAELKVGPSL